MRRRPSTANVIVIHARQIIVHERICVDNLHRCCQSRRIAGSACGMMGGEDEHSPQPLSAAREGVFDRIANFLWKGTRVRLDHIAERSFY